MARGELGSCSCAACRLFGWHSPAPFRLGPPLSYGHFPRERGKAWCCASLRSRGKAVRLTSERAGESRMSAGLTGFPR